MSWLKKKLFKKKISIAVIGIGNTGCKIADLFIQELQESKITVKSLAINQTDNFVPSLKGFSEKFWFSTKENPSSNRNLDAMLQVLEERKEDLANRINKILLYKKGETKTQDEYALHLIIASAGGTGAAGAMIVSNIIKQTSGTPPTVIFVLPEKDEPSFLQYNAARALYYMGFGFRGPQCPIVLFDNEKLLKKFNDEPIDQAIKHINEYLSETLTTTILAALQESTEGEFQAGLNDFFAAFSEEATGLGVIISLDREFESLTEAQKIRFSDLFFKELDTASSLSADLTRAKRGYLTITVPYSYQTIFETRKIVKRFEKGNIKVSLANIDEPVLSIRGVVTGIHPDYVDRFWEVLELGRDARNKMIELEHKIDHTRIVIEKE
ncbi:MAG: hypothetical protein ACTSYD_00195 [Candidatus Heimdallarchaeaceae archaeon]